MLSKTSVWISGSILTLVVVFVVGVIMSQPELPEGYHVSESEKFWSAQLHQSMECVQKQVAEKHIEVCNKQVIPSTLVDYTVQGDYLLALRADRDAHFTKELCGHCMQQNAPCVDYWVINTKSHTSSGPLDKQGFEAFLLSRGLEAVQLKHEVPASAKHFCSE